MFDPSKHRKTAERLAELKTKSPQEWEIRKPKKVTSSGYGVSQLMTLHLQ